MTLDGAYAALLATMHPDWRLHIMWEYAGGWSVTVVDYRKDSVIRGRMLTQGNGGTLVDAIVATTKRIKARVAQ